MNLGLLTLVWLLPLSPCGATTTAPRDMQEAPTSGRQSPAATTGARLEGSTQTLFPNSRTEAPTTFPAPPRLSSATVGRAADAVTHPGTPLQADATQGSTATPTSTQTSAAPSEGTTATSAATTSRPVWTTAVSTATAPPTRSASTGPARPPKTKPPKKKEGAPTSGGGASHGTVVAWVIGGALLLMMLSFLFIYVRKRKMNEEQATAKNWAGPSPFIEGGGDDGQAAPAPARPGRISISSFLPQRASRRLSLLPEADEEMEDIGPGTTFGERRKGGQAAGAAAPAKAGVAGPLEEQV